MKNNNKNDDVLMLTSNILDLIEESYTLEEQKLFDQLMALNCDPRYPNTSRTPGVSNVPIELTAGLNCLYKKKCLALNTALQQIETELELIMQVMKKLP